MKSKVDMLSEGRIIAVVKMLACDKLSTFWGGQNIHPVWVGMSQ